MDNVCKQGENINDMQLETVWHMGSQWLVAHVMFDKYRVQKKKRTMSMIGTSLESTFNAESRIQAWGRRLSGIWQAICGNEKQPEFQSQWSRAQKCPLQQHSIHQPWNEKEVGTDLFDPRPSRRPNPMDLLAGTSSVEMEIQHQYFLRWHRWR